MTRNKIFELIFGKLSCFVIAEYDDDYFEDYLSDEELEAIKERMIESINYIQGVIDKNKEERGIE